MDTPTTPRPTTPQIAAAEQVIAGYVKNFGAAASDVMHRSLAFAVHAIMSGNPGAVAQHLQPYLNGIDPKDLVNTAKNEAEAAAVDAEKYVAKAMLADLQFDDVNKVLRVGTSAAHVLGIPVDNYHPEAALAAAVAEATALATSATATDATATDATATDAPQPGA